MICLFSKAADKIPPATIATAKKMAFQCQMCEKDLFTIISFFCAFFVVSK